MSASTATMVTLTTVTIMSMVSSMTTTVTTTSTTATTVTVISILVTGFQCDAICGYFFNNFVGVQWTPPTNAKSGGPWQKQGVFDSGLVLISTPADKSH
jgi:hypothetical protein